MLPPLGRPYVITIGYETEEKYVCEQFVIYDELRGQFTMWGEVIYAQKIDIIAENIEMFIERFGIDNIKNVIQKRLWEKKEDVAAEYNVPINLSESDGRNIILYLRRKAPHKLNWVKEKTESEFLKSEIEFIQSIQIFSSEY